MSTCRRTQIDSYLAPYTKPKSKWIKENKVGRSLECIGPGDDFLNVTPIYSIVQILRATVNKRNWLKLKSFWKAKGMVNKTKC